MVRKDLAFQNSQHIFQLSTQLPNDLLALIDILFRLFTGESLTRTTNGEAVLLQ